MVWNSQRDSRKKDCVLFMSRLKIVSGLPYKIVIESWNTHASLTRSTSVEGSARGLKEKRERSQSVPLTLPASYSLFLRNILRTKIRQTLKFERLFSDQNCVLQFVHYFLYRLYTRRRRRSDFGPDFLPRTLSFQVN